jgi:hypothetical protein
MRLVAAMLAVLSGCCLSACYSLPIPEPAAPPVLSTFAAPPKPEESRQLLAEMGGNWVYGSGLGETALHAGAIVMCPPYALVLIGNSLFSLSGRQPVGVSDFLPESGASVWSTFYTEIVSVPGRMTAGFAQEEYRSPDVVRKRMRRFEHLFAPAAVSPRLPPST